MVLIEQIRVIDKTRLIRYLGKLSEDEMKKIDYSIIIELGVNNKFNLN